MLSSFNQKSPISSPKIRLILAKVNAKGMSNVLHLLFALRHEDKGGSRKAIDTVGSVIAVSRKREGFLERSYASYSLN